MAYYVYILKSLKDGKYYIGSAMSLIYHKEEKAKWEEQINFPNMQEKSPMWQTVLHFFTLVIILVFANWGKPGNDVISGGLYWLWTNIWYTTSVFGLVLVFSLIYILKMNYLPASSRGIKIVEQDHFRKLRRIVIIRAESPI